jgi:hypothetical protein
MADLHLGLSEAKLSSIPNSSISLCTVFLHVTFGLPTDLFPDTSICSTILSHPSSWSLFTSPTILIFYFSFLNGSLAHHILYTLLHLRSCPAISLLTYILTFADHIFSLSLPFFLSSPMLLIHTASLIEYRLHAHSFLTLAVNFLKIFFINRLDISLHFLHAAAATLALNALSTPA